jgi:hypothetical protein
MPLDPDKLREVGEKAAGLSKRFDSFMERHKNDPEDEDEDEDDDDCDLKEDAERATETSSQPEVE